jgi:hypothetical protein
MSGSDEVLQHIPLAVTSDPPSSVTLPPPSAEVSVMLLMIEVETTGKSAEQLSVVKLFSSPYVVPSLLVA